MTQMTNNQGHQFELTNRNSINVYQQRICRFILNIQFLEKPAGISGLFFFRAGSNPYPMELIAFLISDYIVAVCTEQIVKLQQSVSLIRISHHTYC